MLSLVRRGRNISIGKSLLAGHSKWANIRHVKAAKDAQKASLFTKLSRQIRLAIREGGSTDPSLNTQLKSVVEDALRKNMPVTTIQNNIQKYKQSELEFRRYRLDFKYKQKVFMVCIVYTDNFASARMDIAPILKKFGATLIDANIFEEIGVVQAFIDKSRVNRNVNIEDMVLEDAILIGAEDVEIINKNIGAVNFICRPLEIMVLRKIIESSGYIVDNTEHLYIPKMSVELVSAELLEYQKFVTKLKDVSGVQELYDNIREHSWKIY